jgi:hypothetical protein
MNGSIRLRVVLVGLLCSGGAWSQVVVDPQVPKAFFEARVKVARESFVDMDGRPDSYDPAQTTVSMVANKITVSPLMRGAPDFATSIPPLNLDQTIGSLPPGTYAIEVIRRATGRGTPGPVGTPVTFTVAPRGSADPLSNYTDTWWTPTESGWGLGLFHHPSNQIFGTLFVYGSDGKPIWYAIPGGTFVAPNEFHGTVYRTTGPYFGGAFNPSTVGVAQAGTAIIAFNLQDSNLALINFTIDGVSFVRVIERLPY